MSAGVWRFTNTGKTYLLDGQFDLDTDVFKMALFASTSNLAATSDTFAGLTGEVSSVSTGYTGGGVSVTLALTGTATVMCDVSQDPTWTATTDGIVARYAVIYEVGGKILCYCPLDSASADISITSGNTLTIAANASGVFTLA